MPPPGYEPFLRAICADPEDDTVRLVYADWLDENGDPDRAEFIRLQVTHSPISVRTGEMVRREDELLQRNLAAWYAELPGAGAVKWGSFIRGFVFGLEVVSASDFARRGSLALSAAPVTHLNFSSVGPNEIVQFVRVPEIRQIKYMSMHVYRKLNGSWRALTVCPHLPNLRSLSILPKGGISRSRWLLTDTEARLLAEAPELPLLSEISLFGAVSAVSEARLRDRFKTVNFRL